MDTTTAQINTIDDYIAACPVEIRGTLQELRQVIKEVAPEATETIKYKMPTFVLHGNLVYFAAWKKHISFYPLTAEMEATLDEIKHYKTSGKGTIQFPLNKPLPWSLIREMVAMRVRENTANKDA